MSKTRLIFDCPETNADLYHATHFLAPDDVLFLEHNKKRIFILSDLEFERGKKEATVDQVYSLAELTERARQKGEKGAVGVIATLLRELKIKQVEVPHNTKFTLVDGLRKKGIKVTAGENPFYSERYFKTPTEKKAMHASQKATFQAIALVEKILRESKIKRGTLTWKGKILTSERVREEVEKFHLAIGFHHPIAPIIAGGEQGCDPHCIGSGPLKPHEAIIVDIFPRSDQSRFFGDATRTFCKGKATPELKRQYIAVKTAQEMAIKMIRASANGKKIYQAVVKFFEKTGYLTQVINGVKQGFIHGVGHGIGLQIHEEPVRINKSDFILKKGNVLTVEPGLYYLKTGGVRIEDIVYVTTSGCEVFPSYPKNLEIL